MAIKDILIWPHPMLKRKSDDVCPRVRPMPPTLCQDLKDTVFMAGGLGLSAIQIGVPLRVMVEHFEGKRPRVWVNPRWKALGSGLGPEKVVDEEGCLSLPDIYERVSRYKSVQVDGLDENGERISGVFHDYHARIFQHEIDHFNGIVYPDRMDPGARDRIRRKLMMKRKIAA